MDNIIETLSQRRIRPTSEIKPHEFLYEWGGKPCFARGELVAVGGKAKSGKTYFCSILAALASRSQMLGLKRPDPNDNVNEDENENKKWTLGDLKRERLSEPKRDFYRVLWVDTEQSEDSTQEVVTQRIGALIGRMPTAEQFVTYNLRRDNWQDRLPLVLAAIMEHDPDLVVFDGIRDCVGNINDYDLAQDVLTKLLGAASESRACIVCVLHQNKSVEDKTLRGALGSELQNKCFEAYECSKDEDTKLISVRQTLTRKYDIARRLNFSINEQGLPEEISEADTDSNMASRYQTTAARPPFNPEYVINGKINKSKLFAYILPDGKQMGWNQLRAVVMNVMNITSNSFADKFINESIAEQAIRVVYLENGMKQYENAQQTIIDPDVF